MPLLHTHALIMWECVLVYKCNDLPEVLVSVLVPDCCVAVCSLSLRISCRRGASQQENPSEREEEGTGDRLAGGGARDLPGAGFDGDQQEEADSHGGSQVQEGEQGHLVQIRERNRR